MLKCNKTHDSFHLKVSLCGIWTKYFQKAAFQSFSVKLIPLHYFYVSTRLGFPLSSCWNWRVLHLCHLFHPWWGCVPAYRLKFLKHFFLSLYLRCHLSLAQLSFPDFRPITAWVMHMNMLYLNYARFGKCQEVAECILYIIQGLLF